MSHLHIHSLFTHLAKPSTTKLFISKFSFSSIRNCAKVRICGRSIWKLNWSRFRWCMAKDFIFGTTWVSNLITLIFFNYFYVEKKIMRTYLYWWWLMCFWIWNKCMIGNLMFYQIKYENNLKIFCTFSLFGISYL